MSVTQVKNVRSRKQLHESVLEKLHHAISDFAHMVHEIKFKELMTNAATMITDGLHMGKTEKKKVVKKKAAPKVSKATVPAAKKAVKKTTATAKKVVKKVAGKK